MKRKKTPLPAFLLALGLVSAVMAGDRPPGDNVVGKVISVGKDSLVVAPVRGGNPVTVKVGESTRVTKERQPYKLENIKPDEFVFANGTLKDNVMEAAMVGVVNPQFAQMIAQAGGPGGPGGGRGGLMMGPGTTGNFKAEDLGKTFIVGEVKAIQETRLTIARPDGQSQDIEVDENTSFKRGNESITLPDIKAGDLVRAVGELKNGVFVPKELFVGRGQRRVVTIGDEKAAPQNPPAEKPATPPPPKE